MAQRLRPLLSARGRLARAAGQLKASTGIVTNTLAPKAKLLLGVLDTPRPVLVVRAFGMVVFSSALSTMAKTSCMNAMLDEEVDLVGAQYYI